MAAIRVEDDLLKVFKMFCGFRGEPMKDCAERAIREQIIQWIDEMVEDRQTAFLALPEVQQVVGTLAEPPAAGEVV